MADFDKPNNLTDYATVWDFVKDVQESLALWQDGTTDANQPTGAKRYSSTNKRFEKFNGTSWEPLIPLDTSQSNAYQIRVAKANEADSVGVATNSLSLGGVAANQFVQTTDARLADARPCNNTFLNAATSRTSLSVYSKLEGDNALLLKANKHNAELTGVPIVPTASVGTNTTQAASTAYVVAEIASTSSGPWLDITILNGWTASRARYRLTNGGKNLQIDIAGLNATAKTSDIFAYLPTGYRPAYGIRTWLSTLANANIGVDGSIYSTSTYGTGDISIMAPMD